MRIVGRPVAEVDWSEDLCAELGLYGDDAEVIVVVVAITCGQQAARKRGHVRYVMVTSILFISLRKYRISMTYFFKSYTNSHVIIP